MVEKARVTTNRSMIFLLQAGWVVRFLWLHCMFTTCLLHVCTERNWSTLCSRASVFFSLSLNSWQRMNEWTKLPQKQSCSTAVCVCASFLWRVLQCVEICVCARKEGKRRKKQKANDYVCLVVWMNESEYFEPDSFRLIFLPLSLTHVFLLPLCLYIFLRYTYFR